MGRSIHVRLDDASDAALGRLRNSGLTDSEAVRVALQEAASKRLARAALSIEAGLLAHDPDDLAEMRGVRELMSELAPEGR